PGHPLHSLLGKLATLVPIGEIGFRLNLLAGASMAAALAGVVALARRLAPDRDAGRAAGIVGAALAALAPPALANATRAEVYGPTAALLVWSLVAVLDFAAAPAGERHGRLLLAAAFGCALAAAIHPVIAAAAALPMAVTAGLAARRRLMRLAPLAVALGALALAAYAYLPVRALAPDRPLLVWGDPSTWSGLWDQVSATAYQRNFSLSGTAGRFAELWAVVGQATGLGVLIGGLVGLVFGAVTRLRGAGSALAVAVAVVLGASLQDRLNPDLAGYVLPALLVLAAGLAPLVAAALRMMPAELAGPGRRARPFAMAVVLVPVAAAGLVAASPPELDRGDDPTRLWAATVGVMPPGPGVYFAVGDHALFADQYERLVAGGRPDIAVASVELCRDEWFVRHLKRVLPELYVPFVDDGLRGAIAERLAVSNMRRQRPVGGDQPAFGRLKSANARPVGRGFQFMLLAADAAPGQEAQPPPDFEGPIGRRIAGLIGMARGDYELERARFAAAARAGGIERRFARQRAQLGAARRRGDRPPLLPLLPRTTDFVVFDDWLRELFADEVAWQAGLEVGDPPEGAPLERVVHARWRRLLRGELEAGSPALLDLGPAASVATTRLLVSVGGDKAVEKHLRAILVRYPEEASSMALLASLLFNRGDVVESEKLFRTSIKLAPGVAETRARLSAVLARQGKTDESRAEWQRARSLDPSLPSESPSAPSE
ncbi:MAG TPA: tetratricopeptide repeat protein, partial [Kofleriaceae bacterium]|nr:tetratricopeptide repeat protein [Kofleriaceae bacterium]